MTDKLDLAQELRDKDALLETAWGVIANAQGWDGETTDWVDAARRWRDRYFDQQDSGDSDELPKRKPTGYVTRRDIDGDSDEGGNNA